jgi:Tol biopolymer transport system component/DNA-binding winged helix-turn-helix (wHTH) protein
MSDRQGHTYEFGPYCIHLPSRVLLREGEPLALEPKIFDTLLVLVQNRTKVVTRDELIDAIWGAGTFVEEGSLTRNISLLRKILAEGLKGTQCIATFPKLGYQFVVSVREVTGASQAAPGVGAHDPAPAETDRERPQETPERGWLRDVLPRHPIAVLAGGLAVLALALGYWLVRPLPAPVVRNHQALTDDGVEKRGPLVADALRLYFEEKVGGAWVLAVVPTAGGNPSLFPLPSATVSISDIAPDGSDLIGWERVPGIAGGRLLIWPVASGVPVSLAGLQGEWPAWSPDRARIAYGDGIHSLFVAGRHGESPRKVASVQGRPQRLRWSPDGGSLRFWQQDPRNEAESLWEVPAQGGKPQPLLSGWRYNAGDPAWTADGNYFLFVSGPAGGTGVWVRREDCNPIRWRCREPQQITAGLFDNSEPLPSRDGRKLFVISGQYKQEVVRYDLNSRTFVPYLPGLLAAEPDISPDGKWVAYARLPQRTLWRSRLDGSNAAALTPPGTEAYCPHWSPDGKQIAYMSVSTQKQYKSCVVPADGGHPQQLVSGTGEEGVPTWSRDGNLLAFGNVLHGLPASQMTIRLLDLRNHQVSTLPGSTGLWQVHWSPDGRYMAALALGEESKGGLSVCPALLLYDFRSGAWSTLARTWSIRNMTWSHDSQYIYFDSAAPDLGMHRVDIISKRVELLASLKGFAGVGDDWIGVAPDGSPLMMKDSRINEIYALDMQWH